MTFCKACYYKANIMKLTFLNVFEEADVRPKSHHYYAKSGLLVLVVASKSFPAQPTVPLLDFYTLTNLVPVLATSNSCSVPRIANFNLCQTLFNQ